MKTNISILVENTTPVPGFIGEYGFAAFVEVGDKKYLFDTGSGDALFHNTRVLGIDLNTIEGTIISHGHFDHTGALLPVIKSVEHKKIYAHSNIFAKRPIPLGNGQFREIGCVCTKQELIKAGAEIIPTDGFTEISTGIYVTGAIPRRTEFEDVGGNFKIEVDGELVDDNLIDDMSIVIDHPEGLIIMSGCAHAGMINTIEYVKEKTGRSKILAFIGGTHLMGASKERLDKTVEALQENDIEKIIVSHCTGFYSSARLYNDLGNKVVKGETGMIFTF